MKIKFRPDLAPNHVQRIGELANEGFYNGVPFHRVIPGFMIQGGDQLRSGTGDTGYTIVDEHVQPHNAAGQLCMANRGPNTNSAQFFITDDAAPHLDNNYTIFGECSPVELVHTIASVEKGPGDMPKAAPVIKKVSVTRK